jgi:hypothetical protein
MISHETAATSANTVPPLGLELRLCGFKEGQLAFGDLGNCFAEKP